MTRQKLGMTLYKNTKTPSWIKKLVYFRWMRESWRLEKQARRINPDNIFEIPINNKKVLHFDLPIHRDLISCNLIIKKQLFEYNYILALTKIINDPQYILDIGANIGNHSLFFSKHWKNSTVYSFEPEPISFNMLKRNIELNSLNNVICHNVAVGDMNGRGQVVHNGLNENNLGATRVDYKKNGEIEFITLDDFVTKNKIHNIDFVKIDVEGFEINVLNGMRNIIKEYNPYIWIEVLDKNAEQAMQLFNELDLSVVQCNPFNQYNDFLLRRKI